MPVTIKQEPSPIRKIEVTCSIDPEIDSMSVVQEDDKIWFRSTRKNASGGLTDYVSVTLTPEEAGDFAHALRTFAEQVAA